MALSFLGLIVILVVVLAIGALAGRGGIGGVLGALALLFVVGAVGGYLLLLRPSREDVSYSESVKVSAGDESISYGRSYVSQSGKSVAADSPKSRIELVPTPSDDLSSKTTPAAKDTVAKDTEFRDTAAKDSSAPDWLQLAETSSYGDSPAVVSNGPRQTESECRADIQRDVAEHVAAYARTHGMVALARRSDLLTDELLKVVVRDAYVSTSPHEFNGQQQTWYTLHQLLDVDSSVEKQLSELNQRARADQRLIVLGAGTVGVLGLLSVAFVLLKVTEPSAAPATESRFGFNRLEQAQGKGPVIVVTAVVVVAVIGLLSLLG